MNQIRKDAKEEPVHYDTLVIGGGIAGEEASLSLANMGFRVLLVEKDYSIGGKMIHLSKVFPTLDCAACISTPKMSETDRHPNITVMTYSEVRELTRINGHYRGVVIKKPRYVKEDDCTGCQLCEDACPVNVPDQYQYDLVGRKAVYIPFSVASPRIAAIDIENCTFCGACEKVCPADAIDFTQKEVQIPVEVKSVIIATGYRLFDAETKRQYGFGRFKNVIHSMHMERQLVPTRPYNTVLRPGDGKMPDNIAYILCVGSRDHTMGNPLCSQVCCMYSIKQAQLVMGALPMADVTIYYIDIRSFGKGFQEFYEQTKGMGVEFVKSKVARISEKENGDLILHYEDIENGGKPVTAEHDLVVLSVGLLPDTSFLDVFRGDKPLTNAYHFVEPTDELLFPSRTSKPGVFVAGTASGPMDIPDTILSAGNASAEAADYLKNQS
ncbi:MAG: CoB--CoM heterodisulfide reductase iron-sulfur subunit A family protein [Bacteroidales bacterium]